MPSVVWERLCVIVCERVRGEKGGQHDKSASVMKAVQTSCSSIQICGPLCSKSHYHRASQTRTMNPCCYILYAWTRRTEKEFLTHICNSQGTATKTRQRRHAWQFQSSEERTTVAATVTVTHFLLSTVHISVSQSNLICVCALLTQQFLNSRGCVVSIPSSASSHKWPVPSNVKLHFSLKRWDFLYMCSVICVLCAAC